MVKRKALWKKGRGAKIGHMSHVHYAKQVALANLSVETEVISMLMMLPLYNCIII